MKRYARIKILLLLLSLLSLPAHPSFAQDRRDDSDVFTPDHRSPFRLVSDVLATPYRTDMDRVAAEVSRVNSMDPNDIRPDDVVRLYVMVPRELVRKLATQGVSYKGETIALDKRTSIMIFTVREQMKQTSWENLSQRQKTEITVLDYGNKKGGAGSDVDQTPFWDWNDPRLKNLDIREKFAEQFSMDWKPNLDPKTLDIETHPGTGGFPDLFGDESVDVYAMNYRKMLEELKQNSGSYYLRGSLTMGVRMPAAEMALKFVRRSQDIAALLEAVEAEEAAGPSPARKAELAERRRRLEIEKKLHEEKSPVTKFIPQENGRPIVKRDADVVTEVMRHLDINLLRNPDLAKLCAAEYAFGNFLKAKACPDMVAGHKHLVRSFQGGACVARGLKHIDFVKLDEAMKTETIRAVYRNLNLSGEELERTQVVLDIATKLRANHTKRGAHFTDADIWGVMEEYLKSDVRRNRLGSSPLAANDADLRRWAVEEYGRLAEEVMIRNNLVAAEAHTVGWLEPKRITNTPEFKALCELRGASLSTATEKVAMGSFFALKEMFAALPEGHVKKIIEQAPTARMRKDLKILEGIVKYELDTYGRVKLDPADLAEGKSRIRKLFDSALDTIKNEWIAKSYFDFKYSLETGYYSDDAITNRVWARIYDAVGYEYKLALDAYKATNFDSEPRWVEAGWSPDKAFAKVVRIGNAESALSVLRTWQRTRDYNEVARAVIMETLYEIPGFTHLMAVKNAYSRGDFTGLKLVASAHVTEWMGQYLYNQGWGGAIPYTGAIFVYIAVARHAVELVGYEIFEPLKSDLADMIYGGFAGAPDEWRTPPPEFTDQDQRDLDVAWSAVKDLQQRLLTPGATLTEDEKKAAQEFRHIVQDLNKKKNAWEKHRQRLQDKKDRWGSGYYQMGFMDPKVAGLIAPGLLGAVVPEIFLHEEAGFVDFTSEKLTKEERSRMESVEQLIREYQEKPGGLDPVERAEKIAALLCEWEELKDKEEQYDLAQEYINRMNASPGLAFEIRRQNVYHLLKPKLKERMAQQGLPSHDEVIEMSGSEREAFDRSADGVLKEVISDFVDAWTKSKGMQLRNIHGWKEVQPVLKNRLYRDYTRSEELDEMAWDMRDKKREAVTMRRERCRRNLVNDALQAAIQYQVDFAKDSLADASAAAIALSAPAPEPTVLLSGAVFGHGEDRTVDWRVKVIASSRDYPPPYEVRFEVTPDLDPSEESQKRELVAVVFCEKEGKQVKVGEARVPFALQPLTKAEDVQAAGGPLLPPRLVVERQGGDKPVEEYPAHWMEHYVFYGYYSPATEKYHPVTVSVNDRNYMLWARSSGSGGSAVFYGQIPLHSGTHRIRVQAEGAKPLEWTVVKKARLTGEPDIATWENSMQSDYRSLEYARSRGDAREMFRSKGRVLIKRYTIAREYMNHERFEDAKNYIDNHLRDMPTMSDIHRYFDSGGYDAINAWDGMLKAKVRACFYLGDIAGMADAMRQRREVCQNRIAWDKGLSEFQAEEDRRQFMCDYWFCLNGWVLMNGNPEEAKKLYAEWYDLCKLYGNGKAYCPVGTSHLYNMGPITGGIDELR